MLKLFMKSRNQKGFTLVELIVVLVILGILAAILVPTMIGWIDKSKDAQYQLEARSVYMAAQTALSEAFAASIQLDDAGDVSKYLNGEDGTHDKVLTEIINNSETNLNDGNIGDANPINVTKIDSLTSDGAYKIQALNIEFTSGNGDQKVRGLLSDGKWTFERITAFSTGDVE